jgi:hypothetical protein
MTWRLFRFFLFQLSGAFLGRLLIPGADSGRGTIVGPGSGQHAMGID